jgi:hypothetical protein
MPGNTIAINTGAARLNCRRRKNKGVSIDAVYHVIAMPHWQAETPRHGGLKKS